MAVRVLIVDDHPSFRASARTLLELVGRLNPELVLLDIALPDTSGFEVAERLAGSRAKVVLTSSREQRDLGRRVGRSGALGFVPKDRLSGQALTALLEDER